VPASNAPEGGRPVASEATSNGFLFFGILAGVAGLVFIVVSLLTPSASSAQDQLSSFQGDPNGYALLCYPLAFAFLVTPFFVYLSSALRGQGSGPVGSGTLLLLLSLYILGVVGALEYGAYWAVSITPAPSLASQTYEAAVWMNVNNACEAVSTYGVAMGVVLLAWAVRQSPELPHWLGVLGLVAGAIALIGAIMASLSGYYGVLMIGFVLPVVATVVLIIWAFFIPRAFRRSRATPPASAPVA
jgi:hypothetical protein